MKIKAFSIDTLGLPLGTKGIVFNVLTPTPVAGLRVTVEAIAASPTGIWTSVNSGGITHIVVREGDFFYCIVSVPETGEYTSWINTFVCAAVQNGKSTNMSQAQFVELMLKTDSLTVANGRSASLMEALKWLDAN